MGTLFHSFMQEVSAENRNLFPAITVLTNGPITSAFQQKRQRVQKTKEALQAARFEEAQWLQRSCPDGQRDRGPVSLPLTSSLEDSSLLPWKLLEPLGYSLTRPQGHHIIGLQGFRLEGTSGGLQSNLTLKVGSAVCLDQVAQGFIECGLENVQGWRRHKFCGQLVPLLDCPHVGNVSSIRSLNFSFLTQRNQWWVQTQRERHQSWTFQSRTNLVMLYSPKKRQVWGGITVYVFLQTRGKEEKQSLDANRVETSLSGSTTMSPSVLHLIHHLGEV